jgi:nitrous-oxide reductase
MMKVIPVFSQDPETGYGYSEETKNLLMTSYGFVPWDDSHHPHLSQTNGDADGRWLFINANNTPRIARIDLTTFETVEIIEIPNTGGNHGSSFVTQNTEYVSAPRASASRPRRTATSRSTRTRTTSRQDLLRLGGAADGRMAWPSRCRCRPTTTTWRGRARAPRATGSSSRRTTPSRRTPAGDQRVAGGQGLHPGVNWKKAEEAMRAGKGRRVRRGLLPQLLRADGTVVSNRHNDVLVLDPADIPGGIFLLPTPKSPHGVDVDPSGELIVAGGKLATVIPVHSFSKMQAAIETGDFDGDVNGIPVLRTTRPSRARWRTRASGRCTPSSTARATPTPRSTSPPRS